MAKGTANPADAFRKAQRKKELKKNKAERAKTRDFALVKKDTFELEDEITDLEAKEAPSSAEKARLKELKAELEKINQKKEEYVTEYPEQRKLVYRQRRRQDDIDKGKEEEPLPALQKRNLFNKQGLPRHAERSIYYDPVMNPYGVPPPGMPYVERSLQPNEIESEAESEDEVIMPAGPPPGPSNADEDEDGSDDDIPMPEGPPPGAPPFPPGPPLPLANSMQSATPSLSYAPPPPSGFSGQPVLPPPSFTHPTGTIPPPPLGFSFPVGAVPPPPPGFPVGPMPHTSTLIPSFPSQGILPPPPGFTQTSLPPPPPGFYPRHNQHSGAISHQAVQGPPKQLFTGHLSLPAKPSSSPSPTVSAAATISAEPQLRDFKKEATAFVPSHLKRKKPGGAAMKVNAAPSIGPSGAGEVKDLSGSSEAGRPDLVGVLQKQFGAVQTPPVLNAGPPAKRTKT